jgi:hypothetical protein
MAVLSFSITADATARISEVLTCLAKFGDTVAIEARREKARHLIPSLPKYSSTLMRCRVMSVEHHRSRSRL